MTHTITTSKGSFLLVDVTHAKQHDLYLGKSGTFYVDSIGFKVGKKAKYLATTKYILEEQAKEVVDLITGDEGGYKDYLGGIEYFTARESFISLLTANKIDQYKNYAILRIK